MHAGEGGAYTQAYICALVLKEEIGEEGAPMQDAQLKPSFCLTRSSSAAPALHLTPPHLKLSFQEEDAMT